MPVLNGLEATRKIQTLLPGTRVLLLTLHSSTELVRNAFRAGARGYVLKSDADQELVRALTLNVLVGEGTYVSPGIDSEAARVQSKNHSGANGDFQFCAASGLPSCPSRYIL